MKVLVVHRYGTHFDEEDMCVVDGDIDDEFGLINAALEYDIGWEYTPQAVLEELRYQGDYDWEMDDEGNLKEFEEANEGLYEWYNGRYIWVEGFTFYPQPPNVKIGPVDQSRVKWTRTVDLEHERYR